MLTPNERNKHKMSQFYKLSFFSKAIHHIFKAKLSLMKKEHKRKSPPVVELTSSRNQIFKIFEEREEKLDKLNLATIKKLKESVFFGYEEEELMNDLEKNLNSAKAECSELSNLNFEPNSFASLEIFDIELKNFLASFQDEQKKSNPKKGNLSQNLI